MGTRLLHEITSIISFWYISIIQFVNLLGVFRFSPSNVVIFGKKSMEDKLLNGFALLYLAESYAQNKKDLKESSCVGVADLRSINNLPPSKTYLANKCPYVSYNASISPVQYEKDAKKAAL